MLKAKLKVRSIVRMLLQGVVGFENFRFYLSRFTIQWLNRNKVETDFAYFLNMVPANKLVLDVGANFGIMTVSLARKAVNGKVFSFEPIPENLKALKRLVKHYKLTNVTIFECAVGDKPGELKMVLPVINDLKIHGLSHVVDNDNVHEGEFFTVPVKRLDDIAELKEAKAIGAIKIDVENFEYEVFTGARELLLKHKPLMLCEIWDTPKRDATLKLLREEFGYQIQVLEDKKLVPFTGQDALNFFMIP